MKILTVLFLSVLIFAFKADDSAMISKKERKFGIKYLTETKKDFLKAVKGLSEAQLNFKTAPERWSIAECIEHIALTETALFQMSQGALKKPAEPAKRSEIKVNEEQIIAKITNRSGKAQAPEFLQPTKKFPSTDAAIKNFTEQRDKIIMYLKSTQNELKTHFGAHPVTGTIDAYQVLILLSAHCKRHTLQIEEVKADANFPK